jgi:hypothetical protein
MTSLKTSKDISNLPSVEDLNLVEFGRLLVNATTIPKLQDTINTLETKSTRPTQGVFYEWGSLLNPQYLPDEFGRLKPGSSSLPKMIEKRINVLNILRDEKLYITKILEAAFNEGYRTAWVQKNGIIFYVFYEQMKENSRTKYDYYYLKEPQVIEMMAHSQSITLGFPHVYSQFDLQLLGYELAIHYRKMNLRCHIYIDASNQHYPPSTMLTIYRKDQPSIQKNQPIYMQPYPHQTQMQPYPHQTQMQPYPLQHPQMQPYPLQHPQMQPYPLHHPQMLPYPLHHPQMMPYPHPQMMHSYVPIPNMVPMGYYNNQYPTQDQNQGPEQQNMYQIMMNNHIQLMKMMDANPNYMTMNLNNLMTPTPTTTIMGEEYPNFLLESQDSDSTLTHHLPKNDSLSSSSSSS